MQKVTANDTRVISFFNAYHDKVKTRPNLYKSQTKIVTVTLPADLIDFANAAAGHSGFGSGARPVGIRQTVGNTGMFIDKVFSSVQNLADFLNSSECDGVEYVEGIKTRHLNKVSKTKVILDKRMAKDAIYAIHGQTKGFSILKGIRNKFFSGKTPVDAAKNAQRMAKLFDETPICEIELTFGTKVSGYDLSVYAA